MRFRAASLAAPVYRILLVNENRHGLVARKAVLEQAGFQTTAADHPEAGLAEFQCAEYDLLITNFRMPGMNGAELIARARRIRPGTLAIVISGVADVLGLDEQNTGADAVIPKSPNEAAHLVRTVQRLLRSRPQRKPAAMAQAVGAPANAVNLR